MSHTASATALSLLPSPPRFRKVFPFLLRCEIHSRRFGDDETTLGSSLFVVFPGDVGVDVLSVRAESAFGKSD